MIALNEKSWHHQTSVQHEYLCKILWPSLKFVHIKPTSWQMALPNCSKLSNCCWRSQLYAALLKNVSPQNHMIWITWCNFPQWQLCMFSFFFFYLNSIWVKNGFIEGQQCSFNISFENVMSYSIVSIHVGTTTKTTKMSALISEIKQTNYSFNISAFRSLPDNIYNFILYSMLQKNWKIFAHFGNAEISHLSAIWLLSFCNRFSTAQLPN